MIKRTRRGPENHKLVIWSAALALSLSFPSAQVRASQTAEEKSSFKVTIPGTDGGQHKYVLKYKVGIKEPTPKDEIKGVDVKLALVQTGADGKKTYTEISQMHTPTKNADGTWNVEVAFTQTGIPNFNQSNQYELTTTASEKSKNELSKTDITWTKDGNEDAAGKPDLAGFKFTSH
jgi:hypothetical protein